MTQEKFNEIKNIMSFNDLISLIIDCNNKDVCLEAWNMVKSIKLSNWILKCIICESKKISSICFEAWNILKEQNPSEEELSLIFTFSNDPIKNEAKQFLEKINYEKIRNSY